jgi:transcriptional regulator with PAS, ATPase and Fis domain
VAALDCTVLILGETGTGKELVARTIHEASNRNRERFLAVNCGSFTPDLLSNELFGHEREAFTGASRGKQGVFEAASGGTIMLDEVGDTPPSMQVQLLRVLQEKTVTRVGGTTEIPVDVRVLAATNVSLKQRVKAGQFREDLYYRLNVFTVRIPPLRERADDVELLGSFFLNKYNRAFRKQVEGISEEVLGLLNAYHFPGNVRELENVIERAVIVCDGGLVLPRHLPERFRRLEAAASRTRTDFVSLAELERGYIRQVLEATGGNKSETAKILGINRASLWRKLKRYDEDDA